MHPKNIKVEVDILRLGRYDEFKYDVRLLLLAITDDESDD
jgi:hypothetical protein